MSTLRVVQTDTLLVEYVPLVRQDLSGPFFWRLVEPFETAWVTGRVTLSEQITHGLEGAMKLFLLKDWHSKLDPMEIGLVPEARWLSLIDKVKLEKCEIVRSSYINQLININQLITDKGASDAIPT